MYKWVISSAMVAFIVVGCAGADRSEYRRDGVYYGVTAGTFRGRWWSYYERGRSFAAGEFHEEAATDYQTALVNRSRDSWRARTYGLHFVPYFPNRELGVTYYYQGRYEEAAVLLENAVDMVDTARGYHYLALTRRALIAAGTLDDARPPTLEMDIAPTVPLREHNVPLRIVARDDVGVSEVRLNDRLLAQRAPMSKSTFQERISFTEGTHEIAVSVTDLADKSHVEKIALTVDLTGPTIGLFTPVDAVVVESDSVYIEGVCVDAHGIAEIRVNHTPLRQGNGAVRLPFDAHVPLELGENRILVSARDLAGNESHTQVSVYRGPQDSTAAHLWLLRERRPDLLLTAQADGSGALPDVPEGESRIVIKAPSAERPCRHNRAVRVAGDVISTDGIVSLTINGVPFEQLTGAPKETFNRRIILDEAVEDEGRIVVTIHAEEKTGESLVNSVEAELRPIIPDDWRMPVAVMAFQGHDVTASLAESIRRGIEDGLPPRFQLVDRQHLEQVLTEQVLSQALADPQYALRLGNVIPAHLFLTGDIIPDGKGGYEIKADVISTETGVRVESFNAFAQSEADLKMKCAALTQEIEAYFPRLSGELILVRKAGSATDLYFDWTTDDGVKKGTYAVIMYEQPGGYDEEWGIPIDPYPVLVGRARIEAVTENNTRARVAPPLEEGMELEQGLAAVTM